MAADGVLCVATGDAGCDNFPEGDRVGEVSAESVPLHAGVLPAQGCESGLREAAPAVRLGGSWLLDPGKAAAVACVVVDPEYLIIMEAHGSHPPAWTVAGPRIQPADSWLLDSELLFQEAPKPRLHPFRDAPRPGFSPLIRTTPTWATAASMRADF